jgi:Group II intron, maturase-specific domain
MATAKNLLDKIRLVLNKTNNTEACFTKINLILRGWCNFYGVGNSSSAFQKINAKLWHLIYKYFWKKYYKMFRRPSGQIMKNNYLLMKNNYLLMKNNYLLMKNNYLLMKNNYLFGFNKKVIKKKIKR